MKYFLLVLLVAVCFCSCKNRLAEDKKDIKKCFDDYKSAVLHDNGNKAADCLDTQTVNYYNNIKNMALSYDSAQVRALPFLDKMQVLLIRFIGEKNALSKMDGKQVYAFMLMNGGIEKEKIMRTNLIGINVEKDFAIPELRTQKGTTKDILAFHREFDKWKLNLISLMNKGSLIMGTMMKESGRDENDLLYSMIEATSGFRPKNDIWQPMK